MQCHVCGAVIRFRRCRRCGARQSTRALIRRLFAADPDAADGVPIPRSPELASPRSRLLAAGLDVSLMVMSLSWVGALGFDPAFGGGGPPLRVRLLAWVAVFAHLVLLEGTGGQTLGKRLTGIRVVDEKTGGPIGWSVATHRAGARALFWFVAFLALADPRWQTLHDRSAGTIVVKERRPAPPEGSPERMEFETTDDA